MSRRDRTLPIVFLTGLCTSCGLFGRDLTGEDCRPRTLEKGYSCTGEDLGFQECRFYFRASGIPARQWCERFARTVHTEPPQPTKECLLESPASWERVPCSPYKIQHAAQCYRCVEQQMEAHRTYVYAYTSDCARGVELVTCNYDPLEATKRLGPVGMRTKAR